MHFALRIALWYAVFGGAWILTSDWLLETVLSDVHRITVAQTYKGWAFVLITATLLGAVVRRELRRREAAEAAVHDAHETLNALVQSAPALIVATDMTGIITMWNPEAERVLGWKTAEAIGNTLSALGLTRSENLAVATKAITNGRSYHSVDTVWRHKDGSPVELSAFVGPLRDKRGTVRGIIDIMEDVREQRQAQRQVQQARERMAVLAKASELLAETLDYQTTLQNVAASAVPAFADWCVVHFDGADGSLDLVAVAHADPAQAALADAIRHGHWSTAERLIRMPQVLETDQALMSRDITDRQIEQTVTDDRHLSILRLLRPKATITAPITARGESLGVMTFIRTAPDAVYGPEDLALAQDLARRAGSAVENARLHHETEAAFQFTRAIAGSMGEGVVAADSRGCLVFINPAAEAILGCTSDELLGRDLHGILQIPEPADPADSPLNVLHTGVAARSDDFLFVRCDGTTLPVAYSSAPTFADGRITGAVVSFHDITDRKRAEESLRFQGQLLDLVQNAVIATDTAGRVTYWNGFAESLFGWPRESAIGRTFIHGFSHPHGQARALLARVLSGERAQGEYRLRRADGSEFIGLLVGAPITATTGAVTGTIVVVTDISDRKRAEEALREQERLYRLVADNASDLVLLLGPDGQIQYASPSHKPMLGYSQAEVYGSAQELVRRTVHPEDQARLSEATAAMLRSGEAAGISYRIRHKMGEYIWVESQFQFIRDDRGGLEGILIFSRDVTERKAFVEQLTHQAFHDPLTNLPNRALLTNRLEHALTRAARRKESVAILFLDLDRFKVINDSLGHQVGDNLLIAMSQRLLGCVRAEDTVARLGGDEFTILLEDAGGAEDAIRVAERVAEGLKVPFNVGGHEVFMTASIGIAISTPGEYADPGTLLRDADVAMYRAKSKGKALYEVFAPGMIARALERLDLETDLRRAVERGEFRLHYQPIVWLKTGRISGVEALVRWEHPVRGLVPPDQFIPLAEETGLILPIGRWVLREACRQLREWQNRYRLSPPLFMSVNLSVRQFQQPGLMEDVMTILAETGLPPESLQLEITESVMMQDDEHNMAILQALKAAGVQLAVDDFGTGYSSLSYVKRFPIDTLKIDREFVRGVEAVQENTAIVRAVIAFGQALALGVTGEGIETAEQAAQLIALGCTRGQGFFYSPPVSPAVIEAYLLRGDAGRPHA